MPSLGFKPIYWKVNFNLGGLYGRMVGRLLVDQFGVQTTKYWAWMDPGKIVGIGQLYSRYTK